MLYFLMPPPLWLIQRLPDLLDGILAEWLELRTNGLLAGSAGHCCNNWPRTWRSCCLSTKWLYNLTKLKCQETAGGGEWAWSVHCLDVAVCGWIFAEAACLSWCGFLQDWSRRMSWIRQSLDLGGKKSHRQTSKHGGKKNVGIAETRP